MATRSSAAAASGGLIGIIVAAVFVIAILAAPLYTFLRSDAAALDAKVAPGVEKIRLAVLNIDENLSAIKDLRGLAHADAEGTSTADLLKDKAVFASIMPELDASTRAIEALEREDRDKRHLSAGDKTVARGAPDAGRAVADLKNKYTIENERLLKEAKTVAGEVKGISAGNERAASHLGVNRALALLSYTEGRVHANRAEFERLLAADLRAEAESRMNEVAKLRREAQRAEAEQPTATVAKISEEIGVLDAKLTKAREAADGLKSMISKRESALEALNGKARALREQLAAMDAQAFAGGRSAGAEFEKYRAQYEELSNQAREAEAEAAALENGTLKGATRNPETADDLLNGPYEGGKPEEGLRDLRERLSQSDENQKSYDKLKSDLTQRQKDLEDRATKLAAARSERTASAARETEAVDAVLADARKHDEQADASSDAALKSFTEAEGYVRAAITGAASRKRAAGAAQTAHPGSPGVETPFEQLSRDTDTEAALQFLSADIAYNSALAHLSRLRQMQAAWNTGQFVAEISGREKPAAISDAIEKVRTAGLDKCTAAIKAYESAAGLIKSSSFKSPSGPPVAGAQFAWQIQVAEAAAHLLNSQLRAEKADSEVDRALAYDLLKQAAQGREQSPLLTPAIGALVYLQQTAE